MVDARSVRVVKVWGLGLLVVAVAMLQGCSTAGPFVTDISSDGNNGLNVEKCSAQMNAFMGTVSNSNCTSEHIQLQARKHDTHRK
ncbi:MAG: hypothetical protein ACYDAZ_09285 [Thermoplasmataceae archaeon]